MKWFILKSLASGKPTFYLYLFQSEAGGAQDVSESSAITSNMGNGMTCYLQLVSIKKLSNYNGLSRGSRVVRHEVSGTVRTPNELPSCASSPCTAAIHVIRCSFNSKTRTLPG